MSSGLRWTADQLAEVQARRNGKPTGLMTAIALPEAASESEHQQALFKWADLMREVHPELELLYAVPNGGKRGKVTGAILKAEGVRAGFPDIGLPVSRGMFSALFIELKRPDGRVRDKQTDWQRLLARYGNKSVVCWSADEARREILNYLSLGAT